MKEISCSEFTALKELVIELTSFYPECGNNRERIEYSDFPEELRRVFNNFKDNARFVQYNQCETYSILIGGF